MVVSHIKKLKNIQILGLANVKNAFCIYQSKSHISPNIPFLFHVCFCCYNYQLGTNNTQCGKLVSVLPHNGSRCALYWKIFCNFVIVQTKHFNQHPTYKRPPTLELVIPNKSSRSQLVFLYLLFYEQVFYCYGTLCFSLSKLLGCFLLWETEVG